MALSGRSLFVGESSTGLRRATGAGLVGGTTVVGDTGRNLGRPNSSIGGSRSCTG